MSASRTSRPRIAGFSTLELVMVLATMGFVAAIAVPRLSSAADNTRAGAVKASIRTIQFAMEFYAAEHFDRMPTENADGSVQTNATIVIARLLRRTDDSGNVIVGGPYGPYLKAWPVNPGNGKKTLRIDSGTGGTGTDGWQFSLTLRKIVSDAAVTVVGVAPEATAIGGGGGTMPLEADGP